MPPYLNPTHRNNSTEQIGTSGHCNNYQNGCLLGNWYEDRFAPKAGDVAVAYPMPKTTYKGDFVSKAVAVRPLIRTSDLGRELLFGGGDAEYNKLPPKQVDALQSTQRKWSQERDPEQSAHYQSTKTATEAELLRAANATGSERSVQPRKTGFTGSMIRDHAHLALRK